MKISLIYNDCYKFIYYLCSRFQFECFQSIVMKHNQTTL